MLAPFRSIPAVGYGYPSISLRRALILLHPRPFQHLSSGGVGREIEGHVEKEKKDGHGGRGCGSGE